MSAIRIDVMPHCRAFRMSIESYSNHICATRACSGYGVDMVVISPSFDMIGRRDTSP